MKKAVKIAAALAAALIVVPAAQATVTVDYGWEDGSGTILSSFGNVADVTNVSGVQSRLEGSVAVSDVPGPNSGTQYLHLAEDPHDGTPQAYLAFIEGLTDGDTITASFYGYDDTPAASPSMRIWGHYANSGDVDSYAGSAGGNSTYTDGSGWSQVSYSWTFDSSGGTRDALVVELRLYSTPSTSTDHTDYFVDDLHVETDNNNATITVPTPEPASLALLAMGGIAILRRRRS